MIVSLEDAQANLAALIDRAAKGETVMIEIEGKPVARLVRDVSTSRQPLPGAWKGEAWIADDFDEPLPPEILKGFHGSD